jgi:hypothetical protein
MQSVTLQSAQPLCVTPLRQSSIGFGALGSTIVRRSLCISGGKASMAGEVVCRFGAGAQQWPSAAAAAA